MVKLLITGGAGFIGSHLAELALAKGYDVLCCDDLSHGREDNVPEGARFIRVDVTSPAFLEVVSKEQPQILSHHAAQIDVRKAIECPRLDAEQNILGMLNVLDAAVAARVERVVFASSGGAIYGLQDVYPADETHRTAPLSPYGITKLTGEKYLDFYRSIHGIDTVALRYSNVYGPRQDAHGDAGVVAIFCGAVLGRRQAKIFGSGEQTRDYVFVKDVAEANLLACAEGALPGPFNIATGTETSVNELWSALCRAVDSDLVLDHAEAIAGEVPRSCLDATRAKKELGWQPTVSIDAGLRETVEWFAEHTDR